MVVSKLRSELDSDVCEFKVFLNSHDCSWGYELRSIYKEVFLGPY